MDLIPDSWNADGSLKGGGRSGAPTVNELRMRRSSAELDLLTAQFRAHLDGPAVGATMARTGAFTTAGRIGTMARLDGDTRLARAADKAERVEIVAAELGL